MSSPNPNTTASPLVPTTTVAASGGTPTNTSTTPTNTTPTSRTWSCKRKTCKNEGRPCCGEPCSKFICATCYHQLVLQKHLKNNPDDEEELLEDSMIFCTLKCLKKTLKQQNARNNANSAQRLAWDTDTPDGKYEGSSEAMLLDWLKTPSNYAFWKGNNIGTSKSEIQQKLANTINAEGMKFGIDRKRDGPSVGSKIRNIEKLYRETKSFMENTGQGIKDDQDLSEEKFKDLIKDRWCHFWDLHEIMGERSCMRQVLPSDDLDDDDNSGIGPCHDDDRGEVSDNSVENNSTIGGSSVASAVEDYNNDSDDDVGQGRGRDRDRDRFTTPPQQAVPPAQAANNNNGDQENNTIASVHNGEQFSSPLRNDLVVVPPRRRLLPTEARAGNSTASLSSSIGTGDRSKKAKKQGKGGRELVQRPGDMFKAILESYRDNDERTLLASEKSQQLKEKELSELARHNSRMEELERVRVAPFLFQAEQAEVDLLVSLEQRYTEMKTRYSVERIAQIFPQFIQFFEKPELTPEQQRRFTEIYNKHNESKGLPGRIDLTK